MPAGQVIPTWLPFPDSEDHENLLRKGVTHILSVHNRAKPVLEVRAWLGGRAGDHPGQQELERDTRDLLLAWAETMLDLHRFAPIYTDLHQATLPRGAQ